MGRTNHSRLNEALKALGYRRWREIPLNHNLMIQTAGRSWSSLRNSVKQLIVAAALKTKGKAVDEAAYTVAWINKRTTYDTHICPVSAGRCLATTQPARRGRRKKNHSSMLGIDSDLTIALTRPFKDPRPNWLLEEKSNPDELINREKSILKARKLLQRNAERGDRPKRHHTRIADGLPGKRTRVSVPPDFTEGIDIK